MNIIYEKFKSSYDDIHDPDEFDINDPDEYDNKFYIYLSYRLNEFDFDNKD